MDAKIVVAHGSCYSNKHNSWDHRYHGFNVNTKTGIAVCQDCGDVIQLEKKEYWDDETEDKREYWVLLGYHYNDTIFVE